jgi:Zn-dependent protease
MDRVFERPLFLLFDYLSNPTIDNGQLLVLGLFSTLAIIFVLFPFHEFAHALAAKLLGDDTAERNGRLTLNPIAHIDPIGAFCMMVLPFGWAKPVPIYPPNATRKISQKGFVTLTAAAGPVSNIVLSYIFIIFNRLSWNAFSAGGFEADIWFYLYYGTYIVSYLSIYLAIFNLFPIPPLDGSKVLYYFLNNRAIDSIERHMMFIRFGFLILLFIPNSPIMNLIAYLSSHIYNALNKAVFFI